MKKDWTYKKLGEVCEILDSQRKPITKNKRESGAIPYYGATGCLDFVKDYIFDEKLVLLGEDGAKWEAGEKSSFIIEGKSWVNNHAHVLRPKRDLILDEFMVLYLNFANLQSFITGVTVPKLNQEKMRSISIPLPSLSEQSRIVSRLDAAFGEIEGLKAKAEAQLSEARTLFQAALTQEMKPKQGWEEKKLGEVAKVIHGKNQKDVLSENGQYPIYGSGGNIMGYANDYLCDAGTTILGRKGSINNPMFIEEPFWNVDTAFGISAKEGSNSKYLYYFIKSIDWQEKNTGTTLPSLTQQVVKDVEIPLPPLSVQQSIVSRLDALSEKVRELEEMQKIVIAECDNLKQALLREVFE